MAERDRDRHPRPRKFRYNLTFLFIWSDSVLFYPHGRLGGFFDQAIKDWSQAFA